MRLIWIALVAVTAASLPLGVALAAGGSTNVNHTAWFAARAAGLVAYGLATASVAFGLAISTWSGRRPFGAGAIYDIHRALALLTMVALGAHLLALALDQYARLGPLDLLVPFASWYRRAWTGVGVIAAYLAIAVYLSFYVRDRIGYRAWRALHYGTFLVFILATLHGLFAGTDSDTLWARLVYAAGTLVVGGLLAYRLLRGAGPRPQWLWDLADDATAAFRATAAVGVVGAAALLSSWTVVHPVTAAPPSTSAAAVAADPAPTQGEQGALHFQGAAGPQGWRLFDQGVEMDVTSAGIVLLRDQRSGQLLFESQNRASIAPTRGRFQALLVGSGDYGGARALLDASYAVSGGRVNLYATLLSADDR